MCIRSTTLINPSEFIITATYGDSGANQIVADGGDILVAGWGHSGTNTVAVVVAYSTTNGTLDASYGSADTTFGTAGEADATFGDSGWDAAEAFSAHANGWIYGFQG